MFVDFQVVFRYSCWIGALIRSAFVSQDNEPRIESEPSLIMETGLSYNFPSASRQNFKIFEVSSAHTNPFKIKFELVGR